MLYLVSVFKIHFRLVSVSVSKIHTKSILLVIGDETLFRMFIIEMKFNSFTVTTKKWNSLLKFLYIMHSFNRIISPQYRRQVFLLTHLLGVHRIQNYRIQPDPDPKRILRWGSGWIRILHASWRLFSEYGNIFEEKRARLQFEAFGPKTLTRSPKLQIVMDFHQD